LPAFLANKRLGEHYASEVCVVNLVFFIPLAVVMTNQVILRLKLNKQNCSVESEEMTHPEKIALNPDRT